MSKFDPLKDTIAMSEKFSQDYLLAMRNEPESFGKTDKEILKEGFNALFIYFEKQKLIVKN